ncbi:MAG: terminase family protein [Chloroflexota bacterium]|nr:terminase family protein [Chloroflexota bacterium]
MPTDYGRLRTDFAYFCRVVLRLRLWPHQVEAAQADAFITAIAAARRTGKTTLAEALAIHTAFAHPGCVVLILSAGQDSARQVTERIGERLTSSPVARGSVTDDFSTRIRLDNGSQIVSLPASQRQVRGYGRNLRLLIIDEAGFVANELWRAAHYTALDERPHSRILMLGTPWGGPDLFFREHFDRGRDGDPDVASFHWTHTVNPTLDHAYLERQRDRVSPAEYAAEVLGEWSDATGALFPRELLDAHTADLEVPALHELSGPARGICGVDWGVSFDRSAAVFLYRLPSASLNPEADPLPRFVVLPYVWPAATPLATVVDSVVARRDAVAWYSVETNGVGAMPAQEVLRRARRPDGVRCHAELVTTTSSRKTFAYGVILGLLERGQLVLPRHPDLLRQLAGLRFEQGEHGFTHIGAESSAVHDDVADALMLATAPHTFRSSKRTYSRLAHYARGRYPVPDSSLGNWSGEVTETPAGLTVFRRPPLQSLAGESVTFPTREDHTEPPTVGRFTITSTRRTA